jgi:hypothetical protein
MTFWIFRHSGLIVSARGSILHNRLRTSSAELIAGFSASNSFKWASLNDPFPPMMIEGTPVLISKMPQAGSPLEAPHILPLVAIVTVFVTMITLGLLVESEALTASLRRRTLLTALLLAVVVPVPDHARHGRKGARPPRSQPA